MKNNIQPNFGMVDNASLVDKVEERLINLLKEKQLKIGDSIPKELDLSESLGVSRTVVREALTRLRLMGLVETKKKKGTVITSPDIFGNLTKNIHPQILSKETLKDMFELRLVLEIGMADILFRRATAQDIKDLKEIVEKEPPHPQHHIFTADQEVKFHGKLYEITRNDSMKKFQKLLLPVFAYVHDSAILKKQPVSQSFVSHKGLVEILENGTPEAFRNAMRFHLENHFLRVLD